MSAEFLEHIILAPHTSFFIGGPARYFCEISSVDDLIQALDFASQNRLPVFILGGGSNVLVSDEGFKGLVIHLINKGIDVVINGSRVYLTVQAGHTWDDVVSVAVNSGWWGIENLSHIPGNVGAFAVQNVGAYGQEASEVIGSVEVFDTLDKKIKQLRNKECNFRYRASIFNREQARRYVILSVTIVLSTKASPNLKYGDLVEAFLGRDPGEVSLQEVRRTIIKIRDKKFPFPVSPEHGNAGSFFRGPVILFEHWQTLKQNIAKNFGPIAFDRLGAMENRLKVAQGYKTPTAFLIELCGYKGLKEGGAMVNPSQPAVILNIGFSTAKDVVKLYNLVRQGVMDKSGILLEHEPEFLGFG